VSEIKNTNLVKIGIHSYYCRQLNRSSGHLRQGLRVYSRNWPIWAQWALFCNARGPFFKRRGPRGVTEKDWT